MLDISQGKSQFLPLGHIVSTSPLGEAEGGQECHYVGPLVRIMFIMNFPRKFKVIAYIKQGNMDDHLKCPYAKSPRLASLQIVQTSRMLGHW